MAKWRVYLGNQHAQCRIYADGRTRREAFRKAFIKARPEFRHYKLAEMYGSKHGTDVMWLAAFNDCIAYMMRGTTSATYQNPKGFNVEVRRL